MLVCTDAWRLLLYFVDDLVAIGRGEAIDTMAYSADNGCRAVTAFPFQCTNAWLSFYICIYHFLFHLSFYIVFTTACTCQKWQIKLFNHLKENNTYMKFIFTRQGYAKDYAGHISGTK